MNSVLTSIFLLIQGVGKLFFPIFCSSEGSESRFFQFSAHPRPRKAAFFSFLLIRGLGKLFFLIFCSSEGSESHFFQFSAHPRGRKAIFSNFLLIRGLGKPFFPIFCSSEGSESSFLFFTPSKPKQILNIMLWQSIQYSKVPNSE